MDSVIRPLGSIRSKLRNMPLENLKSLGDSLREERQEALLLIPRIEESIRAVDDEIARRNAQSLLDVFGAELRSDPMWRADTYGQCTYASDRLLESTGWTRRQMERMSWVAVVEPTSLREFLPGYLRAAAKGETYSYRYVGILSSLRQAEFQAVVGPRFDNGQYLGVSGVTWRID